MTDKVLVKRAVVERILRRLTGISAEDAARIERDPCPLRPMLRDELERTRRDCCALREALDAPAEPAAPDYAAMVSCGNELAGIVQDLAEDPDICWDVDELTRRVSEWKAALAAPAESEPDVYVLHFDDADMPIEVFMGYGARDAAFRRYAQARASWECHLLAPVTEPVPEPEPEPALGCGQEFDMAGFRVLCGVPLDPRITTPICAECTGEGSDDG